MKTNILQGFVISLIFICLATDYAFPQSNQKGTLIGRVTASDTKETLPYANIVIYGTNNGTATDIDGNFILRNITAGKQKAVITYVGYEERVVEITILPGKEVKINISLKPHSIETNAVVVTAQAKGQLNAINQQVNSSTIKNVVSPERLQQNPDANAAEALGRLPGLSLIRSGGEGVGIVIRGMDPSYSAITVNGITLPSTSSTDRSTSISGISQFLLQTVEVIKAKTPDMDGNSVAGTINLELGEAPDSLVFNLLAQGGYNDLNSYWGNYKFVGSVSDRLFNSKLGVRFDADVERVNRSTQTMSAGYLVNSNVNSGLKNEQVLLNSVNLNDITNIPDKQSGTLVLDYSFSPSSKIVLYNLLSRSGGQSTTVTKYSDLAHPVFNNNISQSNGTDLLYSSSLKVKHTFSWSDIDYGVSFSQTHNYSPMNKSWSFISYGGANNPVDNNTKKLTPQQVLALFPDMGSNADTNLARLSLYSMGYSQSDLIQKNVTPYFDIKVPFNFGNSISGYIKGGAKYNYTDRNGTFLSASQNPTSSTKFGTFAAEDLSWVQLTPSQAVNALGLIDHNVNNYLDGQYNFGWYPNMGRLNQLWDWWNNISNYYLAQGKKAVINKFGSTNLVGFVPDILSSSINDQNITEKYFGTYLMSEVNYEKFITTVFGARYEKVTDDLNGHYVNENATTYGLSIPGTPTSATHNDEYWLPMVHLQVNPTEWMKVHMAYTQALSRPDFSALMPNTDFAHTFTPYSYSVGNPYLKPELWKNYDLQVMFYNNEIGLFSINGFYKKVNDKIWQRSYTRIPGDPVVPGFGSNDQVQVTEWLNHKDPGYVKGLEFEWQTSFWYLPSPFNYFSLNFNYTILKSEQQYPTTRVWTTYTYNSQGRPTPVLNRVDSAQTDQMVNQPNIITNVSLGFNYKGLDAWLSFQFNGKTLTGWNSEPELIPFRSSFYRWDFQLSQKLPVDGMQLLFNVANIGNNEQIQTMMGDTRPTYIESYGWTSDLGLRYSF
jgi:TonB-dependent receptor